MRLGRAAEARVEYEAVASTASSTPDKRLRGLAARVAGELALADGRPEEAAQRLADRTVSVETAFTLGQKLTNAAPTTGGVAVRGLRYADGKLTLTLTWHDLPKGTAASAIEYERPLQAGAWAQPAQLALFATLGGTGKRIIHVPLKRVCQPTRVRADIYLDGARVRSQTGPGVTATC